MRACWLLQIALTLLCSCPNYLKLYGGVFTTYCLFQLKKIIYIYILKNHTSDWVLFVSVTLLTMKLNLDAAWFQTVITDTENLPPNLSYFSVDIMSLPRIYQIKFPNLSHTVYTPVSPRCLPVLICFLNTFDRFLFLCIFITSKLLEQLLCNILHFK